MKLKLNKKNIKNLSQNNKELPAYITAQIAGGVDIINPGLQTTGCPPTHGPGEMDHLPWNPVP